MNLIDRNDYTYLPESDGVHIYEYRGTEETVHIPAMLNGDPVTVIGPWAFAESAVKTVIIPNGVVTIGNSAFLGCESLTHVIFPQSLKEIQYSAFEGCCTLEQLSFSYSLNEIGESAFDGCSSLVHVDLPDSVTRIRNEAFAGCASLKSCNIPDSLVIMEDRVFKNCPALTLTVTPGRYLEAYAIRQQVPFVLRKSNEGRSVHFSGTSREERLRDALYQLINQNTQKEALALTPLDVRLTEERMGSWKMEAGHWVGYPGYLVRLCSFQFPEENMIDLDMKEALMRCLSHPQILSPICLSFRMPLLEFFCREQLRGASAELAQKLPPESLVVSVQEVEAGYGDIEYTFAVSGDTLYILEEYWYD